MIGSKEAQREPLPDRTTVIFLNDKEIVIRSPLAENRNALFYEAFDRNTGRVIVMKEFFPGHWVRHDSAPVLNGWEQYSAEEVRRGRLYIWLRHQAEREQQINWKLCCSVRCVIPEKKPLYAAMAGGAIAGASAMLMGVVTYAFSMPGITSIATYVDGGNNFFKLLIVMAIAWISGFVISFVMNKKEQ